MSFVCPFILNTPAHTHTDGTIPVCVDNVHCVLSGVSTGVSSVVHQVQALQLLSLLLPEENRETLRVNPSPQYSRHISNLSINSVNKQPDRNKCNGYKHLRSGKPGCVSMVTGSAGLPT